jgi:hypothetical protein
MIHEMAIASPWLARLARDFVRAGDLYFQRGELRRATDMYARAGRYPQAAKLAAEMGEIDLAVSFHLRAGNPRQAGEVLAEAGRLREAVGHYEASGALLLAADACRKLEQWPRAGRYFERGQSFLQAAECYSRAGADADAARVLAQESQRLAGSGTGVDERRRLDLRRAELLARVGKRAEAAGLLRQHGMAARAAPLFEQSGAMEEAVAAYLEANQVERALRLLDRAPALAPALRADVLRRGGRHAEAGELLAELGQAAEAAACFETEGLWERAAALWEEAGYPENAAHAWYRAERYAEAARCFSESRQAEWAIDAYARAGDPGAAGRLALESGQTFRAAAHFLKAGDLAGASRALQSVPAASADYERATLALVPLLLEQGMAAGALHRLRALPPPSGAPRPERWYWEGRSLEALDEWHEARGAYERAAAVELDFRDVAQRLAALRERELVGTGPVSLPETGPLVTAALSSLEPGPFAGPMRLLTLPTGRLLAGRYEILGELGRGGMSRVYRARDRELGEVVAIKTLVASSPEHAAEEEDRLLREVQLARRITHPNVVRVYDIGRFAGGIFLTMELVEGQGFDQVLREAAPLPLKRARDLLVEIVRGLEAAHALRIIHRDLKPSNVVVLADGAGAEVTDRIKILDFGIARLVEPDLHLTAPGDAIGSPAYMSPEQIRGAALDGRADLYSLGVVAYQSIAGREPFRGKSPSEVLLLHLQEPPPDPRTLRPDLPEPWVEFLSRLLAKSADARYGSAAETLAALLALPA